MSKRVRVFYVEYNPNTAGSSAPACWPTFSEYGGGGVLLSPTTLPDTVVACCETADLLRQVCEQFSAGREVLIHHGCIVAAQSVNAASGQEVSP